MTVVQSPKFELQQLARVRISDSPVEELGRAAIQRARRFANPADRYEFIAGRVALWRFAASLLGVDPVRLAPDYSCPQCGPGQDHGRPGFLLDGGPSPLVLSASRAAGWVLMAGVVHPADGRRLGVDLESVESAAFEGFDDVALTASEKASLATIPGSRRPAERARLWARKEAWLKMTGEGLRKNPAEVDVLDRPGIWDITSIHGERQELPEGLVAAVAIS